MEDGNFLEFIYFSSFTISVNLPNQLVINMSEPVLKSLALWKWVDDESYFCTRWKNVVIRILEFI